MASSDELDTIVVYSVKELLSSIHDSVNRVEIKLDDKASKDDFRVLSGRVLDVENLAAAIKNRAIGASAIIGMACAASGYIVAILFGGK